MSACPTAARHRWGSTRSRAARPTAPPPSPAARASGSPLSRSSAWRASRGGTWRGSPGSSRAEHEAPGRGGVAAPSRSGCGHAARRPAPRPNRRAQEPRRHAMGLLIDGKWHDRWYDTKESGGRFVRREAPFRNWMTADGRPGPSGEGGFAAEPGRYHLYVSLACPWAHRTLIFRKLKGLEGMIGVSVVHWHMGEQGWTFDEAPGATGDRLHGSRYLHEVYTRAMPGYSGRVTVPVL